MKELNPSIEKLLEATLCEEYACDCEKYSKMNIEPQLKILILDMIKNKKIKIYLLYLEISEILSDNTKAADSKTTNIKEQYPQLFRLTDGESEPFDFRSLYNDNKLLKLLYIFLLGTYPNLQAYKFHSTYNNKQYFQLLKIVEILLDVCKDMNITLQKLSELLRSNSEHSELERNIKKHLDLHKFSSDDLYNTASTVFADLLYEGLSLCVPTYQKERSTVHYKLKIKTILQGLYFHLYQYDGELRFCLNCNMLFQVTNARQKYCCEECGNNTRARRAYQKRKIFAITHKRQFNLMGLFVVLIHPPLLYNACKIPLFL